MTYEEIEMGGGIQWPFPAGSAEAPSTVRRLYVDGVFANPDGRGQLIPTQWASFPEQPNVDFPLILNTRRTVEHWHTRTKTGAISILQRMSSRAGIPPFPLCGDKL
jgi:predicted molibdopterin-dependent oxidoreductase YjgC